MNNEPILILEADLFYEDEVKDTKSIISKYFDIELVEGGCSKHPSLAGKEFRTSLNMARFMKTDMKPFDCMSWVPYLREFMIAPQRTFFNELGFFTLRTNKIFFPMFLRPSNGYKTFSGQVFHTYEKFMEEYNFVKQQNYGDDLMCMYSYETYDLEKEYRCVYIDNKFVDMSVYMDNSKKHVVREYRSDVQAFADKVLQKLTNVGFNLNIPNLVIDVALIDDEPNLIEINRFECSSFYECDLDKIYGAWSKQALAINV